MSVYPFDLISACIEIGWPDSELVTSGKFGHFFTKICLKSKYMYVQNGWFYITTVWHRTIFNITWSIWPFFSHRLMLIKIFFIYIYFENKSISAEFLKRNSGKSILQTVFQNVFQSPGHFLYFSSYFYQIQMTK